MTASTPDPYQLSRDAAAAIAEASGVLSHDLALVLGSGWSGAADLLGETVWQADATSIPGFRPPAVAGHVGTLRSLRVEGTGARVLVLGARTHFYEGAGVDAVVHGVRTAAATGARTMPPQPLVSTIVRAPVAAAVRTPWTTASTPAPS